MQRLNHTFPRLLADIVGTKARFGWQATAGRGAAGMAVTLDQSLAA